MENNFVLFLGFLAIIFFTAIGINDMNVCFIMIYSTFAVYMQIINWIERIIFAFLNNFIYFEVFLHLNKL